MTSSIFRLLEIIFQLLKTIDKSYRIHGKQQDVMALSKRLPFNGHCHYVVCRWYGKRPEEKPLVSEHAFQESEDSTVVHYIDVFVE